MFVHSTLPGLPACLWQAAFLLDLTRRHPGCVGTEELHASAAHWTWLYPEVLARRKAAEAIGR